MAAQTTPYITQQDDILDLICFRRYGVSSGAVEIVLLNNPFLRNYPLRLPAGLTIQMPALTAPQKRVIKIWD